MKTLINITLVASLAALTAQAAETTTTTLSLTDGYAYDLVTGDPLAWDGVGNGANYRANNGWTVDYIGSAGGSQLRRSFFNTTLPTDDGVNTLSSSADISNATLKVWYQGTNVVTEGLSIFYDTRSATPFAAGMYSSDWTDTGIDIANGAAAGYYEFDVTALIQGSYDEVANNIASFRFQVDNDTTTFTPGTPANAKVYGKAATDPLKAPVLILTTVPEPSSFALLAGCFALTSIMVRRRR